MQSDIAYRYKLDSESVRQQFVDDFLGEVLGKKKNEALKTLLNNPMIARARIRITPFWRDQISYDSRDVVFKIQE